MAPPKGSNKCGGTASWDGTAGTKWATTSGGAGGAAIPTSSDNAIFDAASGAVTVTIATGNTNCLNLDTTNFTGTIAGTATISVFGNLIWGTGITRTYSGTLTFAATSGTKTVTMNGKGIGGAVTFNGVGGTWQFQDAFVAAGIITLTNGALDANNKDVTATVFSSSGSATRSLIMGSGQWTLTGNNTSVWNTGTNTNFTLTRGSLPVICNYSGSTGNRTLSNTLDPNTAVDFKITAGTDTVIPSGVRSLDFTGFSGSLTTNTFIIYGGIKLSSTMTVTATANPITLSASSGSYLIDPNGYGTIDRPITISATSTGAYALAANVTLGSTRSFNVTSGSFDMDIYNLTAGTFNSSGTTARTMDFGSGTMTLTGNATTIYTTSSNTNLTVIRGNPVVSNYAGSTGARTFTQAASASTVVDINVTGGSDTVTVSTGCRAFDFTGFSGKLSNSTRSIYGNFTVSSGMSITAGSLTTTFADTSTITSNGKTFDMPVTVSAPGATVTLADNLTIGSTRTLTLTSGTLDINGKSLSTGLWSSSNSNARVLDFGFGTLSITGSGTTIWTMSTVTNFSFVDQSTPIQFTYSGSVGSRVFSNATTESQAMDIAITAGTDTVSMASGFKHINWTGFSGTASAVSRTQYGGLTISPTMTVAAGTATITFAPTSLTHEIRSNGVAMDIPITINAPGGTIRLYDALSMGTTRTLTHTAGTFDANDKDVTVGTFSSSNSNTRALLLGNGNWYLTATGTVWNITTSTNLTLTPELSTINFTNSTAASKTFEGGGRTYYNFTEGSTSTAATTINGNNTTFNKITITNPGRELRFFSGLTFNVNELAVNGDGTANNWLRGTTNQFTLVNTSGGDLKMDYAKVEDMIASPIHSIKAGKNSYSFGGNRGVDFYIQPGVM